jgi:uncharacterized protein YqgC (DUF456 family)
MEILGFALLAGGMLLGLAIIPLGLPGAAVILACILIYALATDFSAGIGVPLFILFSVLTVVAETADNWLTAVGARRYGASATATWLSLAGGLLGAIMIGSPLALVLGPLGPVVGGAIGAFAIVVFHEYRRRRNLQEAVRAGWGTFLGRVAGMILKIVLSIAMIIAALLAMIG